jgi:hypothetical protein
MARTKQAARKLLRAKRSASDNEEVPVSHLRKINLVFKKPSNEEQSLTATRRSKRRLIVSDNSDSEVLPTSTGRFKRRNIVHDDSEPEESVPILPEILAGKTDVAYQNPKRRLVYSEPDTFSKNNLKKISAKYFCLDMDGNFKSISGVDEIPIGENDVLKVKSEDTIENTHCPGNMIKDSADASVEDSAENSEDVESSQYTFDNASDSSNDNVDNAEKSFNNSDVEQSENSEAGQDDFEEEESENSEAQPEDKKTKIKNSGFVLYEVDSESDKEEDSDNGDDEPEDGIDLFQSGNDELELSALDKNTKLLKINLKIQKHYRAINQLQRQAKNLEKIPLSLMSKFNCLLQ